MSRCLTSLARGVLWTLLALPAFAIPMTELPDWKLPSIEGDSSPLASLKGKKATVLVFVSIDCPLSNGYAVEINKLTADYAPKGVAVIAINPNDGQSLQQMARHAKSYQLRVPVLKDSSGKLASALGVTHCPEACLFDEAGRLCYRGRIDDRYIKRGGSARNVREADLRRAIDEALAAKSITNATTTPVGCPIPFKNQTRAPAKDSSLPTFSRDVVRILQKDCQECHRQDGMAPFALETYEQALSWAEDIKTYTADGSMPPWMPAPGYGVFKHPRRMAKEDIATLARWVDAGAPEGDLHHLPAPMKWPTGWTLGTPDVVLESSEEFHLDADGEDVYRNFVFPTNLPEDAHISAYEVLPGNNRVVHHVLLFVDTQGIAKRLDARQPGPGYSSQVGLPGFLPSGGLGGWAPGNLPHVLGDGMVRQIPKGSHLVMQVHYHKSGKPETDRTKIGLYFARYQPKRAVAGFAVLPPNARWGGLMIPPGASNHRVVGHYVIPFDMDTITVTPHMHLLGKDMKVWAETPDGRTIPLIYLPRWDFNWQETYNFDKPVFLPARSVVRIEAHFDNSAENPNNPNNPPKLVTWGEQTTEEMCIAFIECLPKKEASSPAELRPFSTFEMARGLIMPIPKETRAANAAAGGGKQLP